MECEGELKAIFALCETSPGQDHVKWEDNKAPALYVYRLGVPVLQQGQGAGSLAMALAGQRAKKLGAEYLRLFVAAVNVPGIAFYEKVGYKRAAGSYREAIGPGQWLEEYGYEIRL